MSIKIGILGYGNLGRGVECAVKHNPDMELTAVFTRRNPADVQILTETAKVYHVDEAVKMKDEIDVLILCGGSATDLPVQTPEFAQYFNVVDSFDTHAKIPEHFQMCIRDRGSSKPVIGKFFSWCLDKGERGGKKLQAKAGKGLFVALLLFVGIPLPVTGAVSYTHLLPLQRVFLMQ